ncbi:hypothetical protein BZA05DRAFT_421399 [Tricharina praecox]|uniref:uncharacterized protein n=1 Tax=Tricharina praecox TaxID=43433 RepID=UPI00221F73B6|nr:uncharacterized protein BZA05DRAFT_421399 [Tricharina praecox]KAI5845320.1 hypothetical protein BZA05DRAFT_421399 [Tricharina praecox]
MADNLQSRNRPLLATAETFELIMSNIDSCGYQTSAIAADAGHPVTEEMIRAHDDSHFYFIRAKCQKRPVSSGKLDVWIGDNSGKVCKNYLLEIKAVFLIRFEELPAWTRSTHILKPASLPEAGVIISVEQLGAIISQAVVPTTWNTPGSSDQFSRSYHWRKTGSGREETTIAHEDDLPFYGSLFPPSELKRRGFCAINTNRLSA